MSCFNPALREYLRQVGYSKEEIRECILQTEKGLRILALEWRYAVDKKRFVSLVGKATMPKLLRAFGTVKKEKKGKPLIKVFEEAGLLD